MTAEQIRHARDLLTRSDNTVSYIARMLGVSRATIYKHVPAYHLPLRPQLQHQANQGPL
jgi:GAF domain-containing protein